MTLICLSVVFMKCKPINPSITKTAPATINQCAYCIAEPPSRSSFLRLQLWQFLDVGPMQAHRTLHSVKLNANDIRAEVSVSCSHNLSSFRGRSLHSAFAKLAEADRIPRLKRHFPFAFSPGGERAKLILSKRARWRTASGCA